MSLCVRGAPDVHLCFSTILLPNHTEVQDGVMRSQDTEGMWLWEMIHLL